MTSGKAHSLDREGLRACIIGAGCSGFTTAKRLKDAGVAYDCFEMSDDIGGNWYIRNPNGLSACYESLHIDTSKWRLAFEDFPVPANWPDFPHHAQLLQYFNAYVDHFGLRPTITFNTRVEAASRDAEGLWRVALSTGETRLYDVLIVCNGHHWDARIPDYPGHFDGPAFHAHDYLNPFSPTDMRGKRIVVVGMGNSAMDIASELSQRPIAETLWVAARRGVWVLPKYMNGRPSDKSTLPAWMPKALGRALARGVIKRTIGRMEDYGLPKPDHEPLDAHPSVSGEFLTRAGCGDIKFKPNIKALEGRRVRFEDDSVEDVDAIVYATGYRISFPFFTDPALQPDADNRFPLFKRMMTPAAPGLFFMGLAQALPTLVNFAEQQSKLVADYLTGQYHPPDAAEMDRITVADEAFHLSGYYNAPRHTIQVDFAAYVADLKKERMLGERRAEAGGYRPAIPARAGAQSPVAMAAE